MLEKIPRGVFCKQRQFTVFLSKSYILQSPALVFFSGEIRNENDCTLLFSNKLAQGLMDISAGAGRVDDIQGF